MLYSVYVMSYALQQKLQLCKHGWSTKQESCPFHANINNNCLREIEVPLTSESE